mgnify:FL=1
MHGRNGQAMVEFALCVFALALVLSALFAFGAIIPRTTRLQSEVRRAAGLAAASGSAAAVGSLPVPLSDNLPAALRPLPALELVTEERHETVDLDALAAEYLFETNGGREYRLHEQTSLPVLGVPLCDVPALTAEGGLL